MSTKIKDRDKHLTIRDLIITGVFAALLMIANGLGGAAFAINPALTMECLYVPLLITASKTADDLSIASITRGIEHPGARTSITELKMRWYDFTAVTVFAIFTILSIVDVSSFL